MTQAFQFVLLTLCAYRTQRLITRDTWPPVELFRDLVKARFGAKSAWYEFIQCPWCLGTWITFGVFTFAALGLDLDLDPHWALQAAAASGLVGLLDSWDR